MLLYTHYGMVFPGGSGGQLLGTLSCCVEERIERGANDSKTPSPQKGERAIKRIVRTAAVICALYFLEQNESGAGQSLQF